MVCNHKMLAKRNKRTGEVTFVGAVSKYSPQEIKALELSTPNYSYIKVPCGRCIGCRLSKAREWAVRIMHENMFHISSSFITLTFDEERLYKWFREEKHLSDKHARKRAQYHVWTLDYKLVQDFLKRFRKEIAPQKIRFFCVGEYGSQKMRPHYHLIIFGYDFPDKTIHSYKKLGDKFITYNISQQLEKLWPFGFHIISDVNEDSACYCARYVTKKFNGNKSDLIYEGRKKEFITMSRNHGIGYEWFKSFGTSDCFPQDFLLTAKKHKIKPPRYYDHLFDIQNPEKFAEIKANRERINREIMLDLTNQCTINDTKERSNVIEDVNFRKVTELIRCYEDADIHNSDVISKKYNASQFGIPYELISQPKKRDVTKSKAYKLMIESGISHVDAYKVLTGYEPEENYVN